MTDAGRRARWRARVYAAAVVMAALAPLPAAAITPSPTLSPAAPALPVAVELAALTPTAPQPADTLKLRGILRNISHETVGNLALQLRYQPSHIGSRGEFDAYACGSGCSATAGGSPLPLPPIVVTATVSIDRPALLPGQTAGFRISAPMTAFELHDAWQVYELGVQVNGTTPVGTTTVGGLRTFLPWAPVDTPGHGLKTRIAWVWPLVDRPHRSVGTTWLDDDLAGSIGDGGRLAALLGAGVAAQDQQPRAQPAQTTKKKSKKPAPPRVSVSPVPVTWAVDPMLVEDVGMMSGGYRVGSGSGAKPGRGASNATAWLDALRGAVRKGELLALPYADPDVVAAARAGLAGQVQVAINSGQTLLSRVLNASPLTYSFPPDGALDQRALDTLFAAGVTTVLLNSNALPIVGGDPSVTPGSHTTVRSRDGNLDALLLDSGLDTVIGIGASAPAKQALAVQRLRAETLMIQAELPSDQRTLVVAPDRRWSPSAAYASTLLTDTGKLPWVEPVPLSQALAEPTDASVTRAPLRYDDRPAELPRSYLTQVRSLSEDADKFAAILNPGDTQARLFDDAVLRTMSSAYRDRRADGVQYRDVVANELDTTKHRVRIASAQGSFVTLTSHSGTVPITVSNELSTPVHVVVTISSQHLTVSGAGRTAETIPAHRQIAVDVRATAKTAGVFPLTVRLLTRNGQVYDDANLFVRSTAYGTVTILITGGATGVLLVAVAIRLGRRALHARRARGLTA